LRGRGFTVTLRPGLWRQTSRQIKNRMTSDLSIFAARLREFISICAGELASAVDAPEPALRAHEDAEFNGMAMVLFALQFDHNPAYRNFCETRKVLPPTITHWTQIPAVPTAAFKEWDLSCLPVEERTTVFHSSGTTAQRPSRHFHNAASLAVYEASLWPWFSAHVAGDGQWPMANGTLSGRSSDPGDKSAIRNRHSAILLTPPPAGAPHSSLVHMFDTVRRRLDAPVSCFVGTTASDGSWELDFGAALAALGNAAANRCPVLLLGTAFSFVHLLDYLAKHNLHYRLPPGSRVMETGGYKGRSRSLVKADLHALISRELGIAPDDIISEYGMSELSSQAYNAEVRNVKGEGRREQTLTRPSAFAKATADKPDTLSHRMGEGRGEGIRQSTASYHDMRQIFHFPPWARARVVSSETGGEVGDGETGLLSVFDLANVFSVMAIQTEDLAIRRGDGFELIGRGALAEPRGCSLMSVEPLNR
jgi:hypothetical protein